MQAVFDLLARSSRPFLIVGGHALAAHGLIRQTIDIDCLIIAEDQEAFGANVISGGYTMTARTENFARYAHESTQMPEIDVLFVDQNTFRKLEHEAIQLHRGQGEFRVPGLAQLIALKLHAIRNQPHRLARDLFDIAELLRLNPGKLTEADLGHLCEKFGPPGIRAKLAELS